MLGCGFGEGLEPALQGVVVYLAKVDRTGQLFAIVAFCDILGDLTGGPVAARLMSIGRGPGHASEGYCFLASSVHTTSHFLQITLRMWFR